MRIDALRISNLRAIRRFEVEGLDDFVVVAGANGSGKSCVFDAVRLMKSLYGGYQANEYHQWFGEFAINLQNPDDLRRLFRDPNQPIEIEAQISYAAAERAYISENVEKLALPVAWQEVTGQPVDYWSWSRLAYATQMRINQTELVARIESHARDVRRELEDPHHTLKVVITPLGEVFTEECKVAEVAFQAYEPENLGVIEYHSASRTYSRQQVGGINLDTRAFEDQRRQQRLYNSQSKYQDVKTKLASSYLRAIIAEKAGSGGAALEDLNDTLSELFQTFFPDKIYEGPRPQPNGNLEFPVRLVSGEEHDIDEMSSGEKEILYGYLQLRNSTPKNSVILLDEPELHLNPSLLQGFADFYYRRLGLALGNQLWLVTHSDTLLRQAVGNSKFRVFHMVPATSADQPDNQALEVLADDDVERVTLSLVGDLATYRPHGKVVVLEGDGEDGFDVTMVRRLFPDFSQRVNLVSGGPKRRVRDLYSALDEAASEAGLRNRFFAITDKDFGPALPARASASEFTWDVYHIENYLLDPEVLREVVNGLLSSQRFIDELEVADELRVCAEELLDRLVLESMQREINERLVAAIEVRAAPTTTRPGADLRPSIDGSLARVQSLGEEFSVDVLEQRASEYRDSLRTSLGDLDFLKSFPGRPILRRFADRVLGGRMDARLFMNAVLDKMVEMDRRPEGMEAVLSAIAER